MHILLIEKDKDDAAKMAHMLRKQKHTVMCTTSCERALNELTLNGLFFHLVILEVDLPIIDGLSLATLIKNQTPHVPILFISSLKNDDKIVQAFRSGAEEYLVKPFSIRKLLSIINNIQKRYYPSERFCEILQIADLMIYPRLREVYRYGERIYLRKKEYELLEFLAKNKEQIMNRNTIMEYVWGYDAKTNTNTLDVHIATLRKKLDSKYQKKLLITVRGIGYKITERL